MGIWSVAQRWRFDLSSCSMRFGVERSGIMSTVGQSLWIGLIAASVALLLALVALTKESNTSGKFGLYYRDSHVDTSTLSVLFSMQVTTLYIGSSACYEFWVVWARILHALFDIFVSRRLLESFNDGLIKTSLSPR
ncbi:hypothetical protein O9993_16800 [Vibrio lentus]|nr:hypothetical protein [Vibrio lentus]